MRNLIIVMAATALCGCAAQVQTKVTAFHELDQPLTGKTFIFIPTKEQEGSLEYRSYAKTVQSELEKRGMTLVPFNQATYGVFMFYGIDDGKEIISTYPIFGQTGTSGAYTSGSVTTYGNTASVNATTYKTPTYGVVGSGTSSDTVFKRYLNIDIVDIKKSTNEKIDKVYEGKAISSGSSGTLSVVMPAMIRSVFDDFPGKSGATKDIIKNLE